MDSDAGEGTGAACEALALERDFPVDFIEIETNLASENARTQRLCRPQGSFSRGKQQRALADQVTRGGLQRWRRGGTSQNRAESRILVDTVQTCDDESHQNRTENVLGIDEMEFSLDP